MPWSSASMEDESHLAQDGSIDTSQQQSVSIFNSQLRTRNTNFVEPSPSLLRFLGDPISSVPFGGTFSSRPEGYEGVKYRLNRAFMDGGWNSPRSITSNETATKENSSRRSDTDETLSSSPSDLTTAPKLVESQTSKRQENKGEVLGEYNKIHYEVILPALKRLLSQQAGVSIGVSEQGGRRRVEIVTHDQVPNQVEIGEAVKRLLPDAFRESIAVTFFQGRAIRAATAAPIIIPKNPYSYQPIPMGASIGTASWKDGMATAGPAIEFNSQQYRVNSFHLFQDHYANVNSSLILASVYHPATSDLEWCKHSKEKCSEKLGEVVLKSGYDITSTRVSSNPLAQQIGKGEWRVVIDWSVVAESSNSRTPNLVTLSNTSFDADKIYITETCHVQPSAMVYSVGRTSGLQIGMVRSIPTYMDGKFNQTGKETHEWTVEQFVDDKDPDEWRLKGLGVGGDSGAAVIDLSNNSLCGQVWGTSDVQDKKRPRTAFITPWLDIVTDIQEKHPNNLRPELPQANLGAACRIPQLKCEGCAMEQKAYMDNIQETTNIIRTTRRTTPSPIENLTPANGNGDNTNSTATTPRAATESDEMDTGNRSSLATTPEPTKRSGTKAFRSSTRTTREILARFSQAVPSSMELDGLKKRTAVQEIPLQQSVK